MSVASDKIERLPAQCPSSIRAWASLNFEPRSSRTESVPMMAADGANLFHNPTSTESLTDKECTGVPLHEAGHPNAARVPQEAS